MGKLTPVILNSVLGESASVDDIGSKLASFWNGTIAPIVYVGATIWFVICYIRAGVKLAQAGEQGAEEKDAAKKNLISITIGAAITFSAATLVTLAINLSNTFWS